MPRSNRTGPGSDDHAPGAPAEGAGAPDAAERRTRDKAHQTIDLAMTQGGQAGIAQGLAAIALAILAGQEPR